MNLTIIPIDGAVYKDGYSYVGLDLSTVPSNVHALQWKKTNGWVEFTDNEDGSKPQNELISELPSWAAACVVKWDEAKANEEAAIEAARSKAEQARIAAL
jgi:hypothetical protein